MIFNYIITSNQCSMPRKDQATPLPIEGHCEHCGGVWSGTDDGALRCACGSLLARFVGGRLELKCKRCKRTVMVDLKPATAVPAD